MSDKECIKPSSVEEILSQQQLEFVSQYIKEQAKDPNKNPNNINVTDTMISDSIVKHDMDERRVVQKSGAEMHEDSMIYRAALMTYGAMSSRQPDNSDPPPPPTHYKTLPDCKPDDPVPSPEPSL